MSAHTTAEFGKIVRDALKAGANETTNPRIMTAMMQLTVADDETLAKLARRLR